MDDVVINVTVPAPQPVTVEIEVPPAEPATVVIQEAEDGAPGVDGAPGQGVVFRGEWAENELYSPQDLATFDGSVYVVIDPSGAQDVNSPPTNGSWALFASKGDSGAPGAAGSDATVNAANVAAAISGAAEMATPVDADKIPLVDSAAAGALKWLSFSGLWNWIRGLGDIRYGQIVSAIKSGDTSRASTTAYADDPHLSIDIPSTGVWLIELRSFSTAADATGGMKQQITFTGAFNSQRSFWESKSLNQGVVFPFGALNSVMRGGSAGVFGFPIALVAATNRTVAGYLTLVLDVTTPGTVKVQWAQNASSATATTLVGGSSLIGQRRSS
jgi:hypothetical protein